MEHQVSAPWPMSYQCKLCHKQARKHARPVGAFPFPGLTQACAYQGYATPSQRSVMFGLSTLVVWLQALQEARSRSQTATAEVQRINKEVKRLEVGIPKRQLEAAAARHQSTDLQQRLTQLSQAAQVHCLLVITGQRSCHSCMTVRCLALLSC